MAHFPAIQLTKIGKQMIGESQGNARLIFVRAELGDGQLSEGEDTESFTGLKHSVMSAPLQNFLDKGNGEVRLRFSVSNREVSNGFMNREIGIFAKLDDDEAKLYAYTNAGNFADYIPSKEVPIDSEIIDVHIIVAGAKNVTAVISDEAYVTRKTFEEHNIDPNAHEHRFSQYLPLTGGVMSGAIVVGNCPGMRKATDSEETYLYGGTTNQDGATFGLLGVNCMSYGEESRGSFALVAKSPSGEKHTLSGLKDGRLLWDRKPIVYPEEIITWQSPTGEEWYYAIRWADGRAEIHGHAIQKANNLGITLNYPIPLVSGITGEATVVAKAGSAFTGLVSFTFGTAAVGYFTVRYHDYSVPNEPISICFTVRGYWK